MLETGWELGEQRAKLARLRQRLNPPSIFVDERGVQLRDARQLGVSQLPVELERELEARRGPIDPCLRDRRFGLPVKRGVDLDRIEVLGVIRELIEFGAGLTLRPPALWRQGVEDSVPRPAT